MPRKTSSRRGKKISENVKQKESPLRRGASKGITKHGRRHRRQHGGGKEIHMKSVPNGREEGVEEPAH